MIRARRIIVCLVVTAVAAAAGVVSTTTGQIVGCGAAELLLFASTLRTCQAVGWYVEGHALLDDNPADALARFDSAARMRPGWAPAHAGVGQAAEALGKFDVALAAYQRAAALTNASDDHLQVLELAGRMGQVDLALRSLEPARPTTWQRSRRAFGGGVAAGLGCAVQVRARGGSAVLMCPKPAWTGLVHAWRASIEEAPQQAFVVLVEDGRRAPALALARERRWTAPGRDHCAASRELLVDQETSALLAILVHPDRADCAVRTGVQLADGGLVRLARAILVDRAERGASEARQLAAHVLKYRLPAHDVAKMAESLNTAGYRLHHSYGRPDEAITAYKAAIAADPRFSWPYHNIGRVYLERKQQGVALEWIDKALAANPDHWRAWKSRAAALDALERYADAVVAWGRALRIEPGDAHALADLGRTLVKMGREDEGLRAMQAAVRLDPTLAETRRYVESRLGRDARELPTASASTPTVRRAALDQGRALDRARAAYQAGRYADALAESRAATNAEPRSSSAALMRAQMAGFMGEFAEARAWHARAGTLAPDDAQRMYAAAAFAVQVGEYDEAVRQLDRLVTLQPSFVRLLFNRAPASIQAAVRVSNPALEQVVQMKVDVLLEKGDLDGARRLAGGHGIVRPGGGYCNAARSRAQTADRDQTFRAFRLAVLGEPEAADCIWWYGQWLTDEGYLRLGRLMVLEGGRATRSQGNRDSAERFVRVRLGREVPKTAEQLFQIARQRYLRDGDVQGAARLFDEAARTAPGFSRPLLYRARMAEDDGDIAGAIGWLERAIAMEADSWRAHRNLGMLLARQQRWPEAERSLRRSLELFGDDPGGRLALARVLYAQGRHADFAQHARTAVQFVTPYGGATEVADVSAFLEKFDRWGPGAALPPAPDPRVLLGWNHD